MSNWFAQYKKKETHDWFKVHADNRFYKDFCANLKKEQNRQRLYHEDYITYGNAYDVINPTASFYSGLRLIFPLLPSRFDARMAQSYIYLSQGQLDILRSYSRWLYETNSYAGAALDRLGDYVIGKGYKYNIVARRDESPSKATLKKANKFLEEFLNASKWYQQEKELFRAKKRDGDVFLRMFPQVSGVTRVRMIVGEQVRSDSPLPERAFGVLVNPEDPEIHLGYEIWSSYTDIVGSEDVPADFMYMMKNQTDANVRRGLSDFFAVHEVFFDGWALNRAARQAEAIRQSIAYIRELEEAPLENIQGGMFQGDDAPDLTVQRFATTQGNPLENIRKVTPGDVLTVSGATFKEGPKGEAAAFEAILRATLRCAGCKWAMPEYMLTGEATANYATSLVQESPFIKHVICDQEIHKRDYCNILTRILEIGIEQDLLPPSLLQECEVLAEADSPATRNLKEEAEVLVMGIQAGLLSKRTATERLGYDPDKEQENIKSERIEDVPPIPPDLKTRESSFTPEAQQAREENRPT